MMSFWNDAIERCVEGHSTPDELAALLMRIDLPDEARQAINETLSTVNGLDQSFATPEAPSDAISKLLGRIRSQPFPAGLESLSAMLSATANPTSNAANPSANPLEADDESEDEELKQLAAALDSFHRSMPVPRGARDRILQRLTRTDNRQAEDRQTEDQHDVRAAFDAGGEQAEQTDEPPTVIHLPPNFFDASAPPDVLAASKETPPPNPASPPKTVDMPDSGGEKHTD